MGTVTTGRVVRSFVTASPERLRGGTRPSPGSVFGPAPTAGGDGHPSRTLADLVSSAEAEIAVLRRLLDDTSLVEEAARNQNACLADGLHAGVKVIEQLDARLTKAREAGTVIDRARATLDGLTALVEQIASARADIEQYVARRADEQRSRMEAAIAAQDAAVETRIAAWNERVSAAGGEFDALASDAKMRARESIGDLETSLRADVDSLRLLIDEHAERVRSRLDVALAEADARLDAVRAQTEQLNEAGMDRAQAICDRAAALVGIEPGAAEGAAPREGSLLHAINAGAALLTRVNDSVLRLAVLADNGDQICEAVQKAALEGGALAAEHARRAEQMQSAIMEGVRATREIEGALKRSSEGADAALARADGAAAALRGFAEVAEAIRAGADAHVQRVREAEATLNQTVARAESAAQTVARCLEQVTAQAADLVTLAKEVGDLITRAEGLKAPGRARAKRGPDTGDGEAPTAAAA